MAVLNGAIPGSSLVPISGTAGARLLSGPAASWERVVAEVKRRYGWTPRPSGPNDGYRPLAVQVSTFLARYTPAKTGGGTYGDVRWWNGVRYVRKAGTAAAAVPGTSNHGKGRAVDVADLGGFGGRRYAEFASVAVPLGWSNAEGRSVNEPWHWVDLLSPETVSSGHAIVPGISVPAGSIALVKPKPPTPTSEEDEMLVFCEGSVWLLSGGRMKPVRSIPTRDGLIKRYGQPVEITPEERDAWLSDSGPGMFLARGPGDRGVLLIGGGVGGVTSMKDEADVREHESNGIPLFQVSNAQFTSYLENPPKP